MTNVKKQQSVGNKIIPPPQNISNNTKKNSNTKISYIKQINKSCTIR